MQNIAFLFFVFLVLTENSFSQKTDSIKASNHFGGAITLTTKGISTIPSFTLGKPAVLFDMSIGKRRLSFEPQFRFSLEGKPWTFIFWWRYKLLTTDKFQISVGTHPALNFRTEVVVSNGVSKKVIVARRYLAAELAPNYVLAKNITIGLYYLYSRGLDKDATRNTHFIGIRSSFSSNLSSQYFIRFIPQFYYLKTDKPYGFYINPTLTLAKKNFPFSISSIVNKALKTDIPGKSFLWNISLIYSFNKEYVEMPQPF
ncbi:MAG TPA: hypothetical protein VM012_09285 [Flavitalea sp.]|nr:hypothetical protein [Flavitalea sp.]